MASLFYYSLCFIGLFTILEGTQRNINFMKYSAIIKILILYTFLLIGSIGGIFGYLRKPKFIANIVFPVIILIMEILNLILFWLYFQFMLISFCLSCYTTLFWLFIFYICQVYIYIYIFIYTISLKNIETNELSS